MERAEGWIRRLSAEIRDNPLPGMPLLELAGDSRVLIECHSGVTEYTTEKIGIQVKYGTILIRGCELRLSHLSRERLVISGRIDSIDLNRREDRADKR